MAVEIKNKRDMKKSLIAIAMVLTLSINADAAAQKHRHTPRTEQVDSTKDKKDAIEAFSDTTSVADRRMTSTLPIVMETFPTRMPRPSRAYWKVSEV